MVIELVVPIKKGVTNINIFCFTKNLYNVTLYSYFVKDGII